MFPNSVYQDIGMNPIKKLKIEENQDSCSTFIDTSASSSEAKSPKTSHL